jgi:hypothetical protein
MDKNLKAVLQLRRDTKENLQQANMVLIQGEPCVEMDGDVFKLKVGDGTTTYNNLPYYMVTSETAAIDKVTCVDGVITIESEGKVFSFDAIAKDANGREIDKTYLKIDDYEDMTGATAIAAGVAGRVPAPGAGAQECFLCADGTWKFIPKAIGTGNTLPASFAGQMFIKKLEV